VILTRFGRFLPFFLSIVLVGALPLTSFAQSPVTQGDIQRLQDGIADVSRDIAQVRSRDAGLADQLQRELDDLRDQTTYLKVKLQKNETVARGDYADLRDRIDNLRNRARGEGSGGYTPPPAAPETGNEPSAPTPRHAANDVPVGSEFDVRIQSTLSSATAKVEDPVDATTMVDFKDEHGRVLIPAGSIMRGTVTSVTKATRTERTGKMTVAFDRLTVGSRSYPVRATVTQAIESEGIKGEAGKIGIGAGAGAILGAILGGAKGALAGILIGGGGTIIATEGKDVELPAGSILRVRFDTPLTVER